MEKKDKKDQFWKEEGIISNLNLKLSELSEFIKTHKNKETLTYDFIVRLARCKELYEKIFPQTKRGGYVIKLQKMGARAKLSANSITTESAIIVEKDTIITASGVMVDKKFILPKVGIINLYDPIVSFVKTIANAAEISKSAIRDRITVARALIEGKVAGSEVESYKANGVVAFSKVLEKVRGLKTRKNAPVLKLLSKSKTSHKNSINKCVNCKQCLATPCPYCGNQVIYCPLEKVFSLGKSDRDACLEYEW
jgi:hypothetical protein